MAIALLTLLEVNKFLLIRCKDITIGIGPWQYWRTTKTGDVERLRLLELQAPITTKLLW